MKNLSFVKDGNVADFLGINERRKANVFTAE